VTEVNINLELEEEIRANVWDWRYCYSRF